MRGHERPSAVGIRGAVCCAGLMRRPDAFLRHDAPPAAALDLPIRQRPPPTAPTDERRLDLGHQDPRGTRGPVAMGGGVPLHLAVYPIIGILSRRRQRRRAGHAPRRRRGPPGSLAQRFEKTYHGEAHDLVATRDPPFFPANATLEYKRNAEQRGRDDSSDSCRKPAVSASIASPFFLYCAHIMVDPCDIRRRAGVRPRAGNAEPQRVRSGRRLCGV